MEGYGNSEVKEIMGMEEQVLGQKCEAIECMNKYLDICSGWMKTVWLERCLGVK